jgi:hypothetical protein
MSEDTDYTFPVVPAGTPLVLTNSIGASWNFAGSDTDNVTFASSADVNNVAFGIPIAGSLFDAHATDTPRAVCVTDGGQDSCHANSNSSQSISGTEVDNADGSVQIAGNGVVPLVSSGNPYSLTSFLTLTLTQAPEQNGVAVSNVNFSGTTTLTALPEPGSIALFGTGLLGLAGLARRRRLFV